MSFCQDIVLAQIFPVISIMEHINVVQQSSLEGNINICIAVMVLENTRICRGPYFESADKYLTGLTPLNID